MSKHIKKEWKFLEYYTVWCEDTGKFEDVCLIFFENKEGQAVEIAKTNPILHHKTQIANARLIAAAPKLLAACKVGLSYIKAVAHRIPRPLNDLGTDMKVVEAAIKAVDR